MSIDTYDAEPFDVFETCVRRARKEHKCRACGEMIRRGDLYSYSFAVFDGKPEQVRRCARCELIYRHLDGLMADDQAVDWELNCGHSYAEAHDCDPPEAIAALAFVTPDEAQQRLLASEAAA